MSKREIRMVAPKPNLSSLALGKGRINSAFPDETYHKKKSENSAMCVKPTGTKIQTITEVTAILRKCTVKTPIEPMLLPLFSSKSRSHVIDMFKECGSGPIPVTRQPAGSVVM